MPSSKHVPLHSFMTTYLRSEPNSTLDASGSSSPVISSHHPRSNSHSPKASGMVSADIDSVRYPSYTSDHRHISSSHKYVSPPPHLSSII